MIEQTVPRAACIALQELLTKTHFYDGNNKMDYSVVAGENKVKFLHCNIIFVPAEGKLKEDEKHNNINTLFLVFYNSSKPHKIGKEKLIQNQKQFIKGILNCTEISDSDITMKGCLDVYVKIYIELINGGHNSEQYKLKGFEFTDPALDYNKNTLRISEKELNELAQSFNSQQAKSLCFSRGAFYKTYCQEKTMNIPNDALINSFLILDAVTCFISLVDGFKSNLKTKQWLGDVQYVRYQFESDLGMMFGIFFPIGLDYKCEIRIDDSNKFVAAVFEDFKKSEKPFGSKVFVIDYSSSEITTLASWQDLKSRYEFKDQDSVVKKAGESKQKDGAVKKVESHWKSYLLLGGMVIVCLLFIGLVFYISYVKLFK